MSPRSENTYLRYSHSDTARVRATKTHEGGIVGTCVLTGWRQGHSLETTHSTTSGLWAQLGSRASRWFSSPPSPELDGPWLVTVTNRCSHVLHGLLSCPLAYTQAPRACHRVTLHRCPRAVVTRQHTREEQEGLSDSTRTGCRAAACRSAASFKEPAPEQVLGLGGRRSWSKCERGDLPVTETPAPER